MNAVSCPFFVQRSLGSVCGQAMHEQSVRNIMLSSGLRRECRRQRAMHGFRAERPYVDSELLHISRNRAFELSRRLFISRRLLKTVKHR